MGKQKLVVLTGAGISAESGLKTFRDSDGLWENYPMEEVATLDAWEKNPQLVLDFYNMRRRDVIKAKPNAAHQGLSDLQADFDVHIITQNIDDLHERAGSKKVLHLHGEILQMRSEKNESLIASIQTDMKIGDRAEDGAQYRPNIVWFGEPVYMIEAAIPIMKMADVFVLIGSSLSVYPAAGLLNYVKPQVKKYVLDRAVPYVDYYENIIAIEKPATEGIKDLKNLLRT